MYEKLRQHRGGAYEGSGTTLRAAKDLGRKTIGIARGRRRQRDGGNYPVAANHESQIGRFRVKPFQEQPQSAAEHMEFVSA